MSLTELRVRETERAWMQGAFILEEKNLFAICRGLQGSADVGVASVLFDKLRMFKHHALLEIRGQEDAYKKNNIIMNRRYGNV